MITNNIITAKDLNKGSSIAKSSQFQYGAFISNYKNDDLDNILRKMIVNLIKLVTEDYKTAFNNKEATSVSNHFKTDAKYMDRVLAHVVDCLDDSTGKDKTARSAIFKKHHPQNICNTGKSWLIATIFPCHPVISRVPGNTSPRR